ncbi:MAG: hypothetical protein M5U09_18715 [Gammaproteobacteria bacterium]|nr:hypothetical protein [Gammaproteobacteria bacterium]
MIDLGDGTASRTAGSAGAAGWGSVTDVPGWGGNLNRLVGDVVEGGRPRRAALPADRG